MDELRNARVYSYTRISYLVVYIIVLIGLFVWDWILRFHMPLTHQADSNWIRFDIPWFFIAIVGWVSTIQRMSYRRKRITMNLDKPNAVCVIKGNAFSGEWRLHKKSPRSLASIKPLTLIALVLIVIMLVVGLMELHQSRYVMMKVNAVQGLCETVFLIGIFVPFLSFWRYPYQVELRKGDKLLSLQYET